MANEEEKHLDHGQPFAKAGEEATPLPRPTQKKEKNTIATSASALPAVRRERIVIETETDRIEGDIILPKDSYRNVLFDYIGRMRDEFITLTNVDVAALDGAARHQTFSSINIARKSIRLIVHLTSSEE